jgi:glycosyltransferase involved in cell wall biosynthesis
VFTTDVFDVNSRLHYNKNPEIIDGIKVFHFNNINNALARRNIPFAPSMFFGLRKGIKKFDIVHLHEYRSFHAMMVSFFAKRNRIPYVVQAHGSVLPIFEKQFLKKLFDAVWGNYILKNASRVISLCESEAEQYRMMGVTENKVEIIPNGIDLSRFDDLPLEGTFKEKYDISSDEKIILFLGRIHKIKGIDLLIDAYCDLIEEVPDVRLVIAGPDDNFLSIIKDKIKLRKPRVSPLFTGPLYDQDKLEAYVDADIYVLPSRYETFPNTILEAWACGTPVVVTDGCQIANIVQNAGLISHFDAEELKGCIKSLLIDDAFRNKLGLAGKELVIDQFDILLVTKKIEFVYQDLIAGCDMCSL